MPMSREQAESWVARFNQRVPPGKDLRYEVKQTKRGWRVRARHPEREARPGLRKRFGAAVGGALINVVFWGAALGGCGYLIAISEDTGARKAAGAGAAACHPDYGGCLDPDAYDYDCAGGSGNGPRYTGYVTVNGADPFGLDADGDGGGCE